jgi:hypothetical protein
MRRATAGAVAHRPAADDPVADHPAPGGPVADGAAAYRPERPTGQGVGANAAGMTTATLASLPEPTTVPTTAIPPTSTAPTTGAPPTTAPGSGVAAAGGAAGWSGRADPGQGACPRPRLRRVRTDPDPDRDDEGVAARLPAARHPPVPDDLRPTPELRRRAHQVLRLTLEVVDGRRPLAHVAPHLEPCALRYVRAACGPRPVTGPPRRLTSLHVSRPGPGAVEVAAVHSAGGRSRVVAARFEGRPDDPARWRCSTLRLL